MAAETKTDRVNRIVLVEDHPIFRLGMSTLINEETDLEVCGQAETAAGGLSAIGKHVPDLAIVDISLLEGDGIELVKEIGRHYPGLPVLVLSMHDESLYAERALMAGARGYIMKEEAMGSVVEAIRQVLTGKIYASEDVREAMLSRMVDGFASAGRSPVDRLTDRELEVFRLIGEGLTSRQIAEKLALSIKTIGTYRENIKEKLDLKHFTGLVKFAVHWSDQMQR